MFALPLLMAAPPTAPVNPPVPRGYVAFKATTPPTIDGKLDDAVWAAAPWSEDFADIEGFDKPAPKYRTRMKMLWDDRALYIAAELVEPNVWATITEHDAVIFHDPDFEVFLDPDGDNHMYAELELNARNMTWDLLLTKPYKDGGTAVNAWEIRGLKTAVAVDGTLNDPRDTDRGWTVEIAWPWAGLKELTAAAVPPADGDHYRINFSRVEWDVDVKAGKVVKVPNRPEHNWVWSPQGVIDMHRPERWGEVQFSTKAAGPVAFRPDPARAVKDRLHDAYYAQHAYRARTGGYTAAADLLKLRPDPSGVPTLEATPRAFTASLKAPAAAGGKTWVLDQDARLRAE
ncbi:hypothetical protein FRUB_05376 [Fimbriiglobus ruber]|uniref:Carbohydrate-binding domain-containing protein n=1 Tax=Fimbriiglobus ruber TaxID=1908690 RepID=A0A225DW80_9BACT|nr:hypothetical protein FRUB_05376 [Fimbriiglobus ruber]